MKNGQFEVGDRVRVKEGTGYCITYPGAVGTVTSPQHYAKDFVQADFTGCPVVAAREAANGGGYKEHKYSTSPEDLEYIPNDALAKEADARMLYRTPPDSPELPIVIRNRAPILFDVDMTLLMWTHSALERGDTIPVEWEGTTFHLTPHEKHIRELKEHSANGKAVIVWSRRGYEWAEVAVKALKLESYVTLILEKPFIYYDDVEADKFMFRLYHTHESN